MFPNPPSIYNFEDTPVTKWWINVWLEYSQKVDQYPSHANGCE